ncbi:D-3-phosphoglycerate dehydrogenase [Streptomyces himastatinicus ATCC 53653]|uniref:D-3-phosphoglycerate dehydrogenase n=1 Tax=Streptomyces himastatinicus ATCC 53653 TaxID=457427 RepID=D9WS82_9ACTN|nr:C-terminal binding protein [Streptomyces himastatinicus]EFL28326.1 D-3-phosphoglycerate dehydrogenase [Streptomyces himastatinicus ATCC 53653]
MFTVVVTDYEFADLEPERQVLEAAGLNLVPAQARTEDELIEICADADAVINQYAPVTAEVIRNLNRCQVISRYGIGLNTIDVPAATAEGIAVANVPDGSLEEVSDHAAAQILTLARGLHRYDAAIRRGTWDYTVAKPLRRLRGRTLGLVGFGRIPQRLAEKMGGFGMTLLAHDPFADASRAAALGVRLVDLDTLCRESDVVSVHAPLTADTEGMIGPGQFAAMKPTACLVNTARGPVVDETALIDALRSGRIAGAALDVFAHEPIGPDSPLARCENVVLTPHTAWYSEDSEIEIRTKTARNVVEVAQGRLPTYLVNHDVDHRVIAAPHSIAR